LRSNMLGLTIDMRGYRTSARTHVREMKLAGSEYAVIAALLCIAGVFIAVQVLQVV
jgi:energy-coupling factor transport system permease protein